MITFQERADYHHLASVLRLEAAEQTDKPLPSSALLGCFDLQCSLLLILMIPMRQLSRGVRSES